MILEIDWCWMLLMEYLNFSQALKFMTSHKNILHQKNKTCFHYHQKADLIRKLYYRRLLYTLPNRSLPDIDSSQINTGKTFCPISMSYLTQKAKKSSSEESIRILVKETTDPLCEMDTGSKYGFWYTTKIYSGQIQPFIDSVESLRGYRMVFIWEQIIDAETSALAQL